MLLLAIETSGRDGGIAVMRDGCVLAERELEQAGRRHAQTLVAESDALLAELGIEPRDWQAVAVSVGPGSFTGLRVGVVCGKTFAWATGSRLAAVDTFQCIAENSPPDVGDVFVIGDAQRGDLFVGRYRREGNAHFERMGDIEIVPGAEWCRDRAASDVVTGPGVERFASELTDRCRVLPAAARRPRAAGIARIGERKIVAGRWDDLWTVEPLYLRKSAAEEKADAKPR